MEIEKFLSGYCRQLDAARRVCAVLENGEVAEVDCCYGSCPYETGCPIARELETA